MKPYQRQAVRRYERETAVRNAAVRRAEALADFQRAEIALGEEISRAYLADITPQEIAALTGLGRDLIVSLARQRTRDGG